VVGVVQDAHFGPLGRRLADGRLLLREAVDDGGVIPRFVIQDSVDGWRSRPDPPDLDLILIAVLHRGTRLIDRTRLGRGGMVVSLSLGGGECRKEQNEEQKESGLNVSPAGTTRGYHKTKLSRFRRTAV
jgi:hypothetical protein